MSECASNGSHISTGRIPLNVCHAVMFDCVHELKVGVQILLLVIVVFWFVEAEIPEVKVEGLL